MGVITEKAVRGLTPPSAGNAIVYDEEIPGFGVRVTAAGAKSFVLNYRINGRERRFTIGRLPGLNVAAARMRAIEWRGRILAGEDPLDQKQAERRAQTVAELAKEYLEGYAAAKKRSRSVRDDKANIEAIITPRIGSLKVKAVTKRDIEDIHIALKATPVRANRVLALLSNMFYWSGLFDATNNPARAKCRTRNDGIEKYRETPRTRFLSEEEMERLATALDAQANQESANVIRLLLLTGARKGEVLSAEWGHFDLKAGVWVKPSHHTKQKKQERVPLNDDAIELLGQMRKTAESAYLFPNREGKGGRSIGLGHRKDVREVWDEVRTAAKLEGVHLHDLRHTFASHAVGHGVSLHIVGRLLGHTQSATTMRYAHLEDRPLKDAANIVGAAMRKKSSAAAAKS
jgi:integrase